MCQFYACNLQNITHKYERSCKPYILEMYIYFIKTCYNDIKEKLELLFFIEFVVE